MPSFADESSFAEHDFGVRWFGDGVLNVSVNCLDRHLAERGDDIALIWEPDDPSEDARRYTYRELHAEVCRFANVLKGQRSEEHTSELQSLMRISYAVF